MWKERLQRGKNNNPAKTGTATRTMLLRMLFVICCIIEHAFGNRLAIPFHSLLFPIPQVSLKVSSKVTLFMNFSNWNTLLRIVILLLCDLVWKPACTKLKRTLWIKAERPRYIMNARACEAQTCSRRNEQQGSDSDFAYPAINQEQLHWSIHQWIVNKQSFSTKPLNSQHIMHCVLYKTLSQLDFVCRVILEESAKEMFKLCLKRKSGYDTVEEWISRAYWGYSCSATATAHLQGKRNRDTSQRPN